MPIQIKQAIFTPSCDKFLTTANTKVEIMYNIVYKIFFFMTYQYTFFSHMKYRITNSSEVLLIFWQHKNVSIWLLLFKINLYPSQHFSKRNCQPKKKNVFTTYSCFTFTKLRLRSPKRTIQLFAIFFSFTSLSPARCRQVRLRNI